MKVRVHLYGIFSREGTNQVTLEVEKGWTVKNVIEKIKLSPVTPYKILLVNEIRVQEDYMLKEGDNLHIFQPVSGG